jgi:hypothetical protein
MEKAFDLIARPPEQIKCHAIAGITDEDEETPILSSPDKKPGTTDRCIRRSGANGPNPGVFGYCGDIRGDAGRRKEGG